MGVLVEERIDHTKWQKWNSNNGFVEGMDKTPEFTHTELQNAMNSLERTPLNTDVILNNPELTTIEEKTHLNTDVILNNPELTTIEENQEEEDELEKNHKHDLDSTSVPVVFTPSELEKNHKNVWVLGVPQ